MKRFSLLALGGALCAMSAFPEGFEVASIKPADPGNRHTQIQISPGGRFVAKGVTVRVLMQQAYDVRDFQISGGPAWLGTERFDINAKAEGEAAISREQLRPLLQSLMADRFKLALKHEMKDGPVYALVAAKGGHKLQASQGEQDRPTAPSGHGDHGEMRMWGMGHLKMKAATLEMLASNLSNAVGRTVIDKTELKGAYGFDLNWTPEPGQGGGFAGGGGMAPHAPGAHSSANNPNSPSIFTALQEQLGLKLDSRRGSAPLLVIERVEKPSEN